MRRILCAVCAAAVLALGSAGQAQAAHLCVVKMDKAEGGVTYTFKLKVDEGTTMEPGDFVTVYNFFGFVEGSAKAPEGLKFSSEEFGKTPALNGYPLVLPVDVPGTPNLTFTCEKAVKGGATVTFTATTRITKTVVGQYSAQVTRTADPSAVKVPGDKPDPLADKEAKIGRLTLPDFRADVK